MNDTQKELQIVTKGFHDITDFDNHQMDEPDDNDTETQRKAERKKINTKLTKTLLAIVKDYLAWDVFENEAQEIDLDVENKVDNAFQNVFNAIYAPTASKALDKAISTNNLADYKIWLKKLSTVDMGATATEDLADSEIVLLDVADECKDKI